MVLTHFLFINISLMFSWKRLVLRCPDKQFRPVNGFDKAFE
jgi:hypothetical protein